ncbi:MAG TPA: type II toxin-antitoxin system RelE/ParE family toxin [Tepidisphaeraceae bacterium]|jgi:addiction module RelE/StbE family toxin|nr:type II toxin-antitoxin system RelE/ParE family toxin [Tepidisphaeraceae bacterium]
MADSYRVFYSPRAASELQKIFDYITEHSPANAPGFLRQIIDSIDSLEQFPHRHPVDDLIKSKRGQVRVLVVSPYLILYQIEETQRAVQLISVRHGARRRPRRL